MKSIYACKLFKSSVRQTKIIAALSDPINVELVTQLEEYLDETNMPPEPIDTEFDEKLSDNNAEFESDDTLEDSESHFDTPHGGGVSGPKLSDKFGDELDAEGNASFDATQITPVDDESDESDNLTTATTAVSKTPVVAETVVTKPFVENHVSLSGLAGELKGTLNARATTAGVCRVSTKNDEVWVHYNDDINLNNVMTAVIDTLNSANYHYLIFNRLARTDNAIVFTINGNDTANIMEPMSNE